MFKMLMKHGGAETCQIQEKHPKVPKNTLKLAKVPKKGPILSKDAEIVNFRTLFRPYLFNLLTASDRGRIIQSSILGLNLLRLFLFNFCLHWLFRYAIPNLPDSASHRLALCGVVSQPALLCISVVCQRALLLELCSGWGRLSSFDAWRPPGVWTSSSKSGASIVLPSWGSLATSHNPINIYIFTVRERRVAWDPDAGRPRSIEEDNCAAQRNKAK